MAQGGLAPASRLVVRRLSFMLRVALTGGIATGKSYIRARIEARGVPTIDADRIVHELLAPRTPVAGAIAERFGPTLLQSDGSVDRRSLGRLVFADPAARADLEAIVHPPVYARIFDWAAAQNAGGADWILADIHLLFETGKQDAFDRVIVASCSAEVQLRRLMARDAIGEEAARARLAAQWPVEEKAARATDVVDTGGTFAETDRRVDAVCAAIDALARRPVSR
jgi:dephospho-CoA kinase